MKRAITVFLTLLIASVAFSQDGPNAGNLPFATQVGSSYDLVDLATSNILMTIPVRTKNEKIPFGYALFANTGAYISLSGTTPPLKYWAINTFMGSGDNLTVSLVWWSSKTITCNGDIHDSEAVDVIVQDNAGTSHPIGIAPWDADGCDPLPVTGVATDGSGYTLQVTSTGYSVWNRSGVQIYNNSIQDSPGTVTDPDGATETFTVNGRTTTVTDSLNTNVLTVSLPAMPASWTYAYTGGDGFTDGATVNYTAYNQVTTFGCSRIADYTYSPYYVTYFPTSISVTGLGTYTITYEVPPGYIGQKGANGLSYVTGRLQTLTYPTGGSVTYTYAGGNNGINCTSTVVPTLTRAVYDNYTNTTSTWKYVNSNTSASTSNFTVVETDPANNQTVYNFAGEYQTLVQYYQGGCPTNTSGCTGGGTELRYVTTCYNGNVNNGLSGCQTLSTPPALPITQTDVYTWVGMSGQALTETIYDCKTSNPCYGLVTEVKKYDYGASIPPSGTPLSDTITVYNTGSSCGTLNAYIHDRPCSVTVNKSGAQVSQTAYAYNAGGHPTKIQQWVNGSPTLTSTAAYGGNGAAAGVLSSVTDVNGNTTSFSNFVCNGMLPETKTLPISEMTNTFVWNCNGGVVTSISDANGQPTGYSYNDPLWRLTSVTDPLQNVTVTKYTTETSSTPATQETYLSFPTSNPTSTVDVLSTVDGLGRLAETQHRTAPNASTFDQAVKYTYGWTATGSVVGPFTTQTVPGGTAFTTMQMDALGRVASVTDGGGGTLTNSYTDNDLLSALGPAPSGENLKQVQAQYDGVGRITASCSIGNGSTTQCAQNSGTANGVTTSYSYAFATGSSTATLSRGAQTRKRIYDALGRMTQNATPEGGTWNYVYDSNVSCPTGYQGVNGLLASSKDPNGNLLCYSYDSMNRVTGVNANNSSCRHFFYDNSTGYSGSIPSGVTTPANPLGRIVEAATDSCSSNTLITDEWFSYDAKGQMTDLWEYTPRSKVYYHTTVGYYANGVANTLSGLPGFSTLTYSVDGEGRWNSATLGTTTVVSSVTYDAASRPTVINIGSGTDKDGYSYDVMERMSQYQFFVGSQNNKGVLTWNPNGSLGELGITDGFNSNDTQTCNFLYDDLARLAGTSTTPGVNCVNGSTTVWSQTFSYDQYDNLTKSGSSSWIPGYNPANNQYQNGATYDADGDLTNDGAGNMYTWNAYEKMATVNGTAVTYDASGRPVAGGSGEILYTPLGKVGVLKSSTLFNNAYVPLPGGGAMSLGCCISSEQAPFYLHRDWIGSSRVASSIATSGGGAGEDYSRSFAPYGEVYQSSGYNDPLLFAGMNADLFATSGTSALLYDTPNRELATNASRWLSPDPAGAGWNQYAYATNPLSNIDPTGLACYGIELEFSGSGDCPGQMSFSDNQGVNGDCTMDGMDSTCGAVFAALGARGAVQCPSDQCTRVGNNGVQYFWASTNGPGNYYSYVGPGSLFYSAVEAGEAGALNSWTQSNSQTTEYGGNVYGDDNGVYSYSAPQKASAPCDVNTESCEIGIDTSQIPDGTILIGTYHTHPDIAGGGTFSSVDIESDLNTGLLGFISTAPFGRVLMFSPGLYSPFVNGVIGAAPPICVLSGSLLGVVACH